MLSRRTGFSHQDGHWIIDELPMNPSVPQPYAIANQLPFLPMNPTVSQLNTQSLELWISEAMQRAQRSFELVQEIRGQLIDYELKTETKTFKKDDAVDADICTICQIEYEGRERIAVLRCGHGYHSECIKKWLMLKNACPLCKQTALINL